MSLLLMLSTSHNKQTPTASILHISISNIAIEDPTPTATMSQTRQSTPFDALRKRDFRQQKCGKHVCKRKCREQNQERNSPLAIFPAFSPPSSDDEAHKHNITSESYSIIEHQKTSTRQKRYDLKTLLLTGHSPSFSANNIGR